MDYEDEYETLLESWDANTNQDAKLQRDRRARELRRDGWTVQIETRHTETGSFYRLDAERKKQL